MVSDCSGPGLRRIRRGRGFTYTDDGGERVSDDATLARVRELAVPPAWTDVWICPDPRGHLQATGTDAARRKQYLVSRDRVLAVSVRLLDVGLFRVGGEEHAELPSPIPPTGSAPTPR